MDPETTTWAIPPWVAVAGGLLSAALGAAGLFVSRVVSNWLKYRKETADIEITTKKATAEIDLEVVEREARVTKDRNDQVFEQWRVIVHGYEERIVAISSAYEARLNGMFKQSEERELQVQTIVDKLRTDHLECLRENGRRDGQIAALHTRAAEQDRRIQELESRLEARSAAKRTRSTDVHPGPGGQL